MEGISKLDLIRSRCPAPDNGTLSRNKIANPSTAADDQDDQLLVLFPRGVHFRPSRFPNITDFAAEMGDLDKFLRDLVGEDVRLEIDLSEDSVALNINISNMLRILAMLLANSVEALLRVAPPVSQEADRCQVLLVRWAVLADRS